MGGERRRRLAETGNQAEVAEDSSMDIKLFQNKDRMLVQLSGRVVLDECDQLKSAIVPRIEPGIKYVGLDLGGVDFIDSAGLGVLVGMKVSSKKTGATLALINPSRGVSDILIVSKLDSIFDILTGSDGAAIIEELARDDFHVDGDKPTQAASSTSPSYQEPPAATPSPGGTKGDSDAISPKERIEQLCRDAIDFMRQRDYDSAIECYKQVLEIEPDYLTAINNLGIVYEKKPQWRELAIEQWERVLELSQGRGDQKHIERAQKHLDALR